MATDSDISPHEGQIVVTLDGFELGHVKEIKHGYFKVDARRARDFWLSTRAVGSNDSGTLRLNLTHTALEKAKIHHFPSQEDSRHEQLLRLYTEASAAIVAAVANIGDDVIDRPLPNGTRTLRQLVHHLANTELLESMRLRRMLAENTPMLETWDETQYARHLHYELPITASLELITAICGSNIAILRALSGGEWQREGNQQRSWPLTVESWFEQTVTNLGVHVAEITAAKTPAG